MDEAAGTFALRVWSISAGYWSRRRTGCRISGGRTPLARSRATSASLPRRPGDRARPSPGPDAHPLTSLGVLRVSWRSSRSSQGCRSEIARQLKSRRHVESTSEKPAPQDRNHLTGRSSPSPSDMGAPEIRMPIRELPNAGPPTRAPMCAATEHGQGDLDGIRD